MTHDIIKYKVYFQFSFLNSFKIYDKEPPKMIQIRTPHWLRDIRGLNQEPFDEIIELIFERDTSSGYEERIGIEVTRNLVYKLTLIRAVT